MSDPRGVSSDAQHFGPPTGSPVRIGPPPGATTAAVHDGEVDSPADLTDIEFRPPSAGDTTYAVPPPAARKSLLQTIAALLGSQLATWVIGLALTVVVPRYLGPDGVGSLGVATALWAVAAILVIFGTGTLLTLEFARDPVVGATLIRPIVRSRIALFVPAMPLVVAFAVVTGQDRTTILVTLALSATVLVRGVGEVGRAGLFGLHRASETAGPDVVAKIALVVVVLSILLLGGGVVPLAVVQVVPAILGAWLLWRRFARHIEDRSGTPQSVRTTLRRGSPYLGGEAALLAYNNIDVIVLATLVSAVEVGWYSVLDTLVASFYFIPTILIAAVFPRFAEVHALDPQRYEGLFIRALRVLVLAGVPIGLGIIVVAEPIVVLLFGEAFREAGAPLQVYGIALVLGFVNVLLGIHAVVIDRQHTRTILIAGGAVATVVLDLILVPWTHERYGNGAVGGVLSYVVTDAAILVLSAVLLARFMLSIATGVHVLKCVVAGVLMMVACWPVRDEFLAIPVSVGLIVYGVAIVALRILTEDERGMIDSVMTKATNRIPGLRR